MSALKLRAVEWVAEGTSTECAVIAGITVGDVWGELPNTSKDWCAHMYIGIGAYAEFDDIDTAKAWVVAQVLEHVANLVEVAP